MAGAEQLARCRLRRARREHSGRWIGCLGGSFAHEHTFDHRTWTCVYVCPRDRLHSDRVMPEVCRVADVRREVR